VSKPAGSRRRRLGAQQRRDQLIQATVDVVAEFGFQAASAEAIARRADVSKGLLWHYFEDFDDLMATTARWVLTLTREAVGSDVDLAAPVPQLLRSTVHRAALLPRTHGPQLRALREIAANLRADDGSLELGVAEYDGLYAAQEAIFRRGQREGDIRPDADPYLLAVSYQGLVDTMLAHLDRHPDLDAGTYAGFVADLLLDGIRAAPGR
jgi:AcrR family transcriptional regulator